MSAEKFTAKLQRLILQQDADSLYFYFVPGSDEHKEGVEPTALFAGDGQRVRVSLAYPLLQQLIEEEALLGSV